MAAKAGDVWPLKSLDVSASNKEMTKGLWEGYRKGMHDTREHRWIVMKSFGLLSGCCGCPGRRMMGGQMQDRERVVVQKEI